VQQRSIKGIPLIDVSLNHYNANDKMIAQEFDSDLLVNGEDK
jgi:hypothetical protein